MPTLHFERALLPTGWAEDVRMALEGARISSVTAGVAPQTGDERHVIGVPGLANLHSHAFQRGMAGLAERRGPATDSFWTWREEMYRFLRVLDPEDVQAIAALSYAEMLEGGFTRVGEFHYLHHDVDGRPYGDIAEMAQSIAGAARGVGIGLTLLPCFYAHGGLGGLPPVEGQRRFINGIDGFARLLDGSRRAIAGIEGANLGVAPHSLRAVMPDEMVELREMAGEMPIHIHAAEQIKEVDDCIAWSGKRPVEWLLDTQEIDARWCLIHTTHMTAEETRRLARSGAIAGLCPVTEANLGDGLFNGRDFLEAGGRLGVGTDSNVQIGVALELRQLEYAQRLKMALRNVMVPGEGQSTGRYLFDAALQGGAQALGQLRDGGVAGLAVGAFADIVTLDAMHPALVHRRGDQIIDGWLFAGGEAVIDTVWCLGAKRVTGGRHIERERLRAAFARVIAKVLAT